MTFRPVSVSLKGMVRVLLNIIAWIVFAMVTLTTVPALAGFPLLFDQTSLSFGNVIRPNVRQLVLNITDTSTSSIQISQLTINGLTPGDFNVVSPSAPLLITPNAIPIEIIVQFSPQGLGNRTADLQVVTSAGTVSIPLSGFGIGGSSLSFSDTIVDFGTIAPGGERDTVLELYSTGIDTAIIDGVTIAASDLSFTASFVVDTPLPLRLSPGDSIAVKISFVGLPLTGIKDGLLGAILEGGINAPTCELFGDNEWGSFEVHQDPNVNFGVMYAGQVRDTTIYLVNTGNVDISFDDLELSPSGDDFIILNPPTIPFTIPIGDSLPVTIRANPGFATSHIANLLEHSIQSSPRIVPGTLTVSVVAPSILGPKFQELSYLCATTSELTDTVPISNPGFQDVIITNLSSNNSSLPFSTLNSLPDTIRPLATDSFIVHFTPSVSPVDTLLINFMGGNQSILTDTLALQSLPSTAPISIVGSMALGLSPQSIEIYSVNSLTDLAIDTLIVHFSVQDPNVASIDPASISLSPNLSGATIESILPEQNGYVVTIGSVTPISASAGSSIVLLSLNRFVSASNSTAIFASVESPEKSGCVTWISDTVMVDGLNVCGSTELGNVLSNRPIFSAVLRENPVSKTDASVLIRSNGNFSIQCQIVNDLGKKLFDQPIMVNFGANVVTIPSADFPSGIYSVHLIGNSGYAKTLRFIKVQ